MLYLVSTPIGNLKDITIRAIEVLKTVDYVLCEDTRHSARLFQAYEIQTKRISFHQFSEKAKEQSIIDDLKIGKSIAIISDAGTPAIADPGERIVKRCRAEGIKVSPIPGPSALIAAISASGLSTDKFQFIGFLPKKTSILINTLHDASAYDGTTICYESPHRIRQVLELFKTHHSSLTLVIARELTKIYEEFLIGNAEQLLEQIENRELKGEIVLLIESGKNSLDTKKYPDSYLMHVEMIEQTLGMTRKEAIAKAAVERGVPKRIVYNALLEDQSAT